MIHYVDPSAWLKVYVDEPGSVIMRALFDGESEFASATLGIVEVLSTLARAERAGARPRVSFRHLARITESDFASFLALDLNADVLDVARGLTETYALRGADTVHLASALTLQAARREEEVIFVTSDTELGAAARLARFSVLDPAEDLGADRA